MRSWLENPIFHRTLQVEQRKSGSGLKAWLRRCGVALLVWLLPLGLITLFCMETLLKRPGEELLWILQRSLDISAFLMLLHCISKAAHGTLNGISLEKEQKTYESLQATLLSPREIVTGKLLSGFLPTWRDLAVTFPLALLMGIACGRPGMAVTYYAVILATSLVLAALGLASSYTAISTQAATHKSTLGVAGLMFAAPLLSMLFRTDLWALSPLGAMFAIASPQKCGWALWPLSYIVFCAILALVLAQYLHWLERRARRVK